jgi:hypothetical protein
VAAGSDGWTDGSRLGAEVLLGALEVIGVPEGDSVATPPEKMPDTKAPTTIARTPSRTKPPIASGLIPDPRRSQSSCGAYPP